MIQASLATAENALSLSTGEPGYIDKINYVIPYIDMGDNNPAHYCSWGCDGKIPGYIPVPYDDTFAGRIFGYLNITTEENYTFNVMIDDGFRLTIGGDVISFFDGLTSITDVNRTIHLTPGLYEFEMVTYENEGGFWNELTWKTPTTSYALIPQDVFFTHVASVPEASTLLLFGSGLAGIIALRRKLSLRI